MNPAAFALKNRTILWVLTVIMIAAGVISYQKMGRLEYPDFTIKTALIVTTYPGASAAEVEEEITDLIEETVQSMGEIKEVYSTSQDGASFVYVDIKDEIHSDDLPQLWDIIRKKIGDVQGYLPPNASNSIVIDDFGDVYGLYFAITGESASYSELKEYAKDLKKELLLCQDVAKIEFYGLQQEAVYIEFKRSKLSEIGISQGQIFAALQSQNVVTSSGNLNSDGEYLRITPTGEIKDEKLIEDLIIGGSDKLVRLGDIAKIYRGYLEPIRNKIKYNGKKSIGFGISCVKGGNVVTMGESIKAKLDELIPLKPENIEINTIYYQSDIVTKSIDDFIVNLVEAVVIVIVLLMIFMGWQSGLLIGMILLLTMLGTFIGMFLADITLQKISLGALILALGMLVDNAIVVADGILVKVEKGEGREQAAKEIVRDTQWPLLGATIIAIVAFAAIGFSPGNVGEFCRSLFNVMAISLFFSWVLAVTLTPLLCVKFLKIPELGGKSPYDTPFYRSYRKVLHKIIEKKYLASLVVLIILFAAFYGFGFVSQAFFPDSTQKYFYINYWRSQGTHIEETEKDLDELASYVKSLEGVENITSFIGEGSLRFIISYEYESPNNSFGQLLVEVDDYKKIDDMMFRIDEHIRKNHPKAEARCSKIANGPGNAYKIEMRFKGKDAAVLKSLSEKALAVLRQKKNIRDLRTDWRQPVRVVRPVFSQSNARKIGITRNDLTSSLNWNYNGATVGVYREKDELLPIISRPPSDERRSIEDIEQVQIYNSFNNKFIPLKQVVSDVNFVWEQPIIKRRDRQKTLTVQCNTIYGLPSKMLAEIQEDIEAIEMPVGYSMEWGGEKKSSEDAQGPLQEVFPICMLAMFIIVVCLFNSVRTPLIIFSTIPLSIIGVSSGMLLTGIPFGFMAILGFLGLSGMLIKNAIVLIDQINLDLSQGKAVYEAVLDSAISRVRPVVMAAGTTVLGMIPLLTDPFYSGMAVTIMSGLIAATFLTLVVVPVMYCIMYRVQPDIKYL